MTPSNVEAPPPRRTLRALLGSPWLRPLNDLAALEDLVSPWAPTWSLTRVKARVVGAKRETAQARTLVLAPNRLWPGHVAGQHVLVTAEVRGRRVARTFSLSSPPRADGLLEITVKRREGGVLSAWWNDVAGPGDVLVLGRPAGEFVLPAILPPRVAMLSAGSGITPLMSMLRSLEARAHASEVRFEHWAATREETIFADELESLAKRLRWLRLEIHSTRESGRPDAAALDLVASRCGDAPAWLCGPAGFRDAMRDAWSRAGHEAPREESFGLATRSGPSTDGTETVVAALSGRTFEAPRGTSLLEAAEAAGLRPPHGCRAGICHTCTCRLVSGTVMDLRDGRVTAEPGRSIQICVSSALSPVCIDV
ncbi:MAG: ferredoxin reductase [Alphaproteobacteria bacterium]